MFYSDVFKFRDLFRFYGFTKMWVKTKSIQAFLGHFFFRKSELGDSYSLLEMVGSR